jgi:hypothetical protein
MPANKKQPSNRTSEASQPRQRLNKRWSFNELGEFLYQQLLTDAYAFQATKLVCVEYANDAAFLAFLATHSFSRIGAAIYNGFEIVRYEKLLTMT